MKKYCFKKQFLAILVLFVLAAVVPSCNKEQTDVATPTQEKITAKDSLPFDVIEQKGLVESEASLADNSCSEDLFNRISVSGDKLHFNNLRDFQATLACLENQVDAHNDAFETQNANLTDDEIDALEEKIGFDDWKPLVDFENRFRFASRRAYIESQIVNWLNNPTFDEKTDPDEQDGLSEELRTLLNVKGEVLIGEEVYNFLNGGSGVQNRDDCFRIKWKSNYFPYDGGNKRFKVKASAYSYPWKKKIKSKVVNYKKKGSGWKRARTRIFVQVGGFVRDADCNFPLQDGAFKGPKRRKTLKTKSVYWMPVSWVKFKKNEIGGFGTVTDAQIAGSVVLN